MFEEDVRLIPTEMMTTGVGVLSVSTRGMEDICEHGTIPRVTHRLASAFSLNGCSTSSSTSRGNPFPFLAAIAMAILLAPGAEVLVYPAPEVFVGADEEEILFELDAFEWLAKFCSDRPGREEGEDDDPGMERGSTWICVSPVTTGPNSTPSSPRDPLIFLPVCSSLCSCSISSCSSTSSSSRSWDLDSHSSPSLLPPSLRLIPGVLTRLVGAVLYTPPYVREVDDAEKGDEGLVESVLLGEVGI